MRSLLLTAAIGLMGSITTPIMADTSPLEIVAPIDRIFVPNGFDDNDNVEVILHGEFRNTCYRVGHAGAKQLEGTNDIIVWATAYHYPQEDCAQVITPFIQTVRLGVMAAGTYRIIFEERPEITQSLRIEDASTSAPDDHFYAPVEFADVQMNQQTGQHEMVVYGSFPRMFIGCALFQEIRVIQQASDMMVVLPILRTTTGEECVNAPVRFRRVVPLGRTLQTDGLLHVRVLSGNSINRFFRLNDVQ